MAVADVPAQRWLYGPGRDLLFGCGLLYVLFFGAFVAAGPAIRSVQPHFLIPLLMLAVSTPHYGATLLRVYEHGEDRRAYAVFTVGVTVALCALFVAGVYMTWVGTLMLTLYLTWSPWHYTGQNYGIAVMFLRRRGVALSDQTKRWLYASFILSYVLLFFVMHSSVQPNAGESIQYRDADIHLAYLGIPRAIGGVMIPVVGIAYIGALVGAAVRLMRVASVRDLLPVAALALTQALWFSLPEAARYWQQTGGLEVIDFDLRTYYFSWIVLGHAAQYLWITSYFAKSQHDWKGQGTYYGKVLLAGNAAWMLPAILLTPDGIGGLSYDLGLGFLVASLVNLHHFILDGAIWKLRSERVAKILIRSVPHREKDPTVASGRRSWGPAMAWGGSAILLLGAAVEFYESQFVLPRAIEQQDYIAADQSLDRMAWIAKDSAQARTELGMHLMSLGEHAIAFDQYERSIELQAGVQAWAGIGQIHGEAGRWREALEAYESALAIESGLAELWSLVGTAHFELGDLIAARRAFDKALQADSELRSARSGLVRIDQASRQR